MRVLFVAIPHSVHTARWISQIADVGWDLHLFPSVDTGWHHSELHNITIYHTFYRKSLPRHNNIRTLGIPVHYKEISFVGRKFIETCFPGYYLSKLRKTIKKIKPDIIHSLEIQSAAYLTLEAKDVLQGKFPIWIVSNWGSDIYLFGRLPDHALKISRILSECDYYSCECHRDVKLAKEFGFNGKLFPVVPNSGGFDIEKTSTLRRPGPISQRRGIMLKGYQHWAGRALVGLRALERCADLLNGYHVYVYLASPDTILAARLFENATKIPTTIIPDDTPHEEMLRLHGHARISIGLSISDAVSTSFLEALVMGSFPIQSWTSCAGEWIVDGENGLLVPPEDPEEIEASIRKALTDDELVNQAADLNYRLAEERLRQKRIKSLVVDQYEEIARDHHLGQRP